MPETPTFASAAVAAPHHLATQAGQAVLAEGGNAVEAMVAMAATIAVVYPHMNAIGGDAFWLIREPNGTVRAIEACGPAGSLATIARYRAKGYDSIPPRGPDAALTVPGAVGGWAQALPYARTLGGKAPLDLLLGDAIRHAKEGYAISRSEARYQPKEMAALREAPGFLAAFRGEDGQMPPEGTLRRAPALGAMLQHLVDAGLEDFYRGDVGREIASDLEGIEAPVTRADLERFEARFVAPLSVRLNGLTAYNFPPPTQGLAALVLLGLFERLDVKRPETFAHLHGLIEASKRAMAVRDAVVTDPAHLTKSPADYLTAAFLDREAMRIDAKRASPYPLPAGDGDTVWMGAIDGSGLAVSYIQSIYWEYGSGCVLPGTGIHMQNRGVAFSLDERSLNPLQPGRKPFHTLNPPLAVFDDGRVASYGAMGGDGQPQFQAQVLSRYRLGMGVADAVDAPRFLFGRTWGSAETTLKVENRFDDALIRELIRAGHEVQDIGADYSDALGHAGLIVKHRNGRVEASHDPRSDGDAKGL